MSRFAGIGTAGAAVFSWLSQTTDNVPLQVLLGPVGLLAFLLVVVVWGGRKRWWAFGRELDACEARENFWKEMAMRSVGTAEEATKVGTKVLDTRAEQIAKIIDQQLKEKER